MKFYDLEWLAGKCGTDNKYEITARVAAEARRESEEALPLRQDETGAPAEERFISNVLLEIEEDRSPISINYHLKQLPTDILMDSAPVFETPAPVQAENE